MRFLVVGRRVAHNHALLHTPPHHRAVWFDEHGAWQRHFFGFDGRKIDVVGFKAGSYYNLLSQRDMQVNVRFDGLVLPNGTAIALTREAAVQLGNLKVHALLVVQWSLPGAGGSWWMNS